MQFHLRIGLLLLIVAVVGVVWYLKRKSSMAGA